MVNLGWILHCILVPTQYYTDANGSIYVREWFSKPKNLLYHLRYEHNLSEAEINEIYLAARRGVKKSHAGEDMTDPLDYL